MKIPAWKYYLSYLFEFRIEDASSRHNPDLYLLLRKGRFQLCTANAIYSYADLYTNFSRAFAQLDLERLPGREVLVLGLGLGSIPYMLEKSHGPIFSFTTVEIDEVVIDLANRYVLQELDSSISSLCADANLYVQQTSQQFDLICVDIFDDDIIPAQFESQEFLQSLKQRMNPGGLVLYNRLAANPEDKKKSQIFFEKEFSRAFPKAHLLDVKGNFMLMNRADYLKENHKP